MANFCILQKHLALNAQNIIVAVSDCDSFGIPPTPPKITIEATPATSMHVFQFSLEEIHLVGSTSPLCHGTCYISQKVGLLSPTKPFVVSVSETPISLN